MSLHRFAIVLPALAATACVPQEEPREFISQAPAARVVGEAESCISPSRVRQSVVHDDRTIDFHVGSRIYRNTLPRRCPGLGFRESITYDIRGGQLCRQEIVYVLDNFGGELRRGAGCSLGDFVPVELIDDEESSD